MHSAHSVVEAKNFLKSYRYNIIILDVSLPDGSGFTLCKFIKNTYFNNYAVIFLTANDAEKDMLRGYDFGADDYITKPFSLVVLEKKKLTCLLKELAILHHQQYIWILI
ncbi:MAG: response regulator [Lacrimispora saccharolytica]